MHIGLSRYGKVRFVIFGAETIANGCASASPTGSIPIKPFIWLAGLRLHLNIIIMNQTIRIENARQLQRNSLGSIAAFHHSINAACEVLTRMKMLPKRQLAFASDTLLHFTIYAGYFLFTVRLGSRL